MQLLHTKNYEKHRKYLKLHLINVLQLLLQSTNCEKRRKYLLLFWDFPKTMEKGVEVISKNVNLLKLEKIMHSYIISYHLVMFS